MDRVKSTSICPDYQQLTLNGTQLSIDNGNSVDLSGLGGGNYGDAEVKTYLNGGWDFNLIPETTATVDIGSPTNLIRHLYISSNSIYMGTEGNTLRSIGTDLLYNGKNLQDFDELINKPNIPVDISDLTDTTSLLGNATPSWADITDKPTTLAALGITDAPVDISDLTDTTGIIQAANTDSQNLTLVGSSLQISGGNSVDLSGISGTSNWLT